jgi:hypothetical protein
VRHLGVAINLALQRETGLSSKYAPNTRAIKAVDGRIDSTNFDMHFASAPVTDDPDPFWHVKLDDMYLVQTVEIISRQHCCPDHMETIEVRVGMYFRVRVKRENGLAETERWKRNGGSGKRVKRGKRYFLYEWHN